MFIKKHPLFFHDEELDSRLSMNGLLLFEFLGASDELEDEIISLKRHALDDLFSKTTRTVTRKVPLEQIIWTDNPLYQKFWSENDWQEEFLKEEDGHKDAWIPRKGMKDSFIRLKKHPESDQFCISPDGNKRVLKSIISTASSPSFVYAKVEFREWRKETLSFLSFIRTHVYAQIHVRICRPRHYRKAPQLILGLRKYSDSRMFFITTDWSESLNVEQELQRPNNELRSMLASWEHLSFAERAISFFKQLFA